MTPAPASSSSQRTGSPFSSTRRRFLQITGVGLGALYFLVASGLSLIYGLMHVLNFAHGAFLTAGAYAAWVATAYFSGLGGWSFPVAVLVGMLVAITFVPAVHSSAASTGC